MIFQDSELIIHFSGISTLIGNLLALLVGFIILTKAIKTRDRKVFMMFLTIVFTISAAIPSAWSYVNWRINGEFFPYEWYVLIGLVGVPIAPLAWLDIYVETTYPKRQYLGMFLYLIVSIIFEVYLFYFVLFAPPELREIFVAEYIAEEINITYHGFISIFLALSISIAVITGIHFSVKTMKIKDKEFKMKGRFLLAGFILMGIGIPVDTLLTLDIIWIIIFRIVLISSTFCFYIGFIMPKWARRSILKKELS